MHSYWFLQQKDPLDHTLDLDLKMVCQKNTFLCGEKKNQIYQVQHLNLICIITQSSLSEEDYPVYYAN